MFLRQLAIESLENRRLLASTTVITEVQVSASFDDAEEKASGNVDLNSSDLELILDTSGDQTVGLRFNGVEIPSGATIVTAYVQFQVDETSSVATSLTIRGEAIDDAPIFTTSDGDITSRTRTTASAAWSPVAWTSVGEAGPDQQTPDIAAVVQEIVDRAGWSSGNSLVVIISGTGQRTAESYDGESTGAPLLKVEYTMDDPDPGGEPTNDIRFAVIGDFGDAGQGEEDVADLIKS